MPPQNNQEKQKSNPNLIEQAMQPAPTSLPIDTKPRVYITDNQESNQKSGFQLPKKLLVLLFIIIIFLITGIGGTLVLAYNNYSPVKPPKIVRDTADQLILLLPLPKTARIIINKVVAESKNLKSADLKSEIIASSNDQSLPISEAKLTISGPIEFNQDKNRRSKNDISLDLKFEGALITVSASLITYNNTIYFKINQLPFGGFYKQLLKYQDQWFFLTYDEKELKKQLTDDSAQNDKIKQIYTDFLEKLANSTTIKSQDGNSYTLKIDPTKEELNNLIFELIASYEPKEQKALLTSIEKENLSKLVDRLHDLSIEVVVGKDDYFPQKVTIGFNFALDNLGLKPNSSVNLLPQREIVINFKSQSELTNHNQQVIIEPPQNARDLKEVLNELKPTLPTNFPTPTIIPIPATPSANIIEPAPEIAPDESFRQFLTPTPPVLGVSQFWDTATLQFFLNLFK